jgi:hypothetical protein
VIARTRANASAFSPPISWSSLSEYRASLPWTPYASAARGRDSPICGGQGTDRSCQEVCTPESSAGRLTVSRRRQRRARLGNRRSSAIGASSDGAHRTVHGGRRLASRSRLDGRAGTRPHHALAGEQRTTGSGIAEALHRRQQAVRDCNGTASLVMLVEDRECWTPVRVRRVLLCAAKRASDVSLSQCSTLRVEQTNSF